MPLHHPTLTWLHHHLLLQFPSIHDLRILNLVSTICTCGFAITATALSIYSGKQAEAAEPCWWMRVTVERTGAAKCWQQFVVVQDQPNGA